MLCTSVRPNRRHGGLGHHTGMVAPDTEVEMFNARWDMRSVNGHPERGAATAEYAIATVAAAGFAGLLAAVLQSAAVKDMVTGLITQALAFVL